VSRMRNASANPISTSSASVARARAPSIVLESGLADSRTASGDCPDGIATNHGYCCVDYTRLAQMLTKEQLSGRHGCHPHGRATLAPLREGPPLLGAEGGHVEMAFGSTSVGGGAHPLDVWLDGHYSWDS
jgi:hypothetical protein